jgi:hypothetical protein
METLLSEDVALGLSSYLTVRDFLSLQGTCHRFASPTLEEAFWKLVIERNHLLINDEARMSRKARIGSSSPTAATSSSTSSSSSSSVSSSSPSNTGYGTSGKRPVSKPMFTSKLKDIGNKEFGKIIFRNANTIAPRVEIEVIEASESDRPEERIENILTISRCKTIVRLERATGLNSQYNCGCAGGMPCYYSSKGSRSPDSDEYVLFRLKNPYCIFGFTVTPYQAFFQAGNPTFAPKSVKLQVLLPNSDASKFMLVYESKSFPVMNEFRAQFFGFGAPLVLNESFWIRLIFEGKQQRQPIFGNNEFYCCISNMKMVGAELFDEDIGLIASVIESITSRSSSSSSGHTGPAPSVVLTSSVDSAEQFSVPFLGNMRRKRDVKSIFSTGMCKSAFVLMF